MPGQRDGSLAVVTALPDFVVRPNDMVILIAAAIPHNAVGRYHEGQFRIVVTVNGCTPVMRLAAAGEDTGRQPRITA